MTFGFSQDQHISPAHADFAWAWAQHWSDVLFLHWAVPAAAVQARLPPPLEVDTYEGQAWVSLVAFRLRVRPRRLPYLPGLSDLVELNVRTYVHLHGQPGIAFLSVHGDNTWAMYIARQVTPMPYTKAAMHYRRRNNQFQFRARGTPSAGLDLAVAFAPHGSEGATLAGSLSAWLLERYRLFAPDRAGVLQQAEVVHLPWLVQKVEVRIDANTAGERLGLALPATPHLAHFSAGVPALFGAFQPADANNLHGGPKTPPTLAEAVGAKGNLQGEC